MRERDVIDFIQHLVADFASDEVDLGIGDDCAVFQTDTSGRVLTSTDMLVEGIHYSPDTDCELIGYKAVSRALSDIAAMGGEPVGCIVAVSFPPAVEDDCVRRLFVAVDGAARDLGAPLIGGDVSSGTDVMVMAVTAFGVPGPAGYVTRSGAQAGDAICVTGRLGGAPAGDRHLTFRPRIQEALYICEHCDVHAMIDISDGFSTDLYHLCKSSNKGAIIQAESLPLHPDLSDNKKGRMNKPELVRHALNDGEDYELLFCVSPADAQRLAPAIYQEKREPTGAVLSAEAGHDGVKITRVGSCIEETNIYLTWSKNGNKCEVLENQGWEHRMNRQQ